jgi:hypothetical protein
MLQNPVPMQKNRFISLRLINESTKTQQKETQINNNPEYMSYHFQQVLNTRKGEIQSKKLTPIRSLVRITYNLQIPLFAMTSQLHQSSVSKFQMSTGKQHDHIIVITKFQTTIRSFLQSVERWRLS